MRETSRACDGGCLTGERGPLRRGVVRGRRCDWILSRCSQGRSSHYGVGMTGVLTSALAEDTVDFWAVIADAVIPGLAIVISAGIAVLLFVAERRSSEKARQRERQDRLLEDIIASLAFFVSVNPLAESWADEFRRLRSRVTILQTLPSPRTRLLAEWLVLEGERGMGMMLEAQEAFPRAGAVSVDTILGIMRPSHDWANSCIQSIAQWMRGDVDSDRVRAWKAELQPSPQRSA